MNLRFLFPFDDSSQRTQRYRDALAQAGTEGDVPGIQMEIIYTPKAYIRAFQTKREQDLQPSSANKIAAEE